MIHDDLPNAAGVEQSLTFGDAANYIFSKGERRTLLATWATFGANRAFGRRVARVREGLPGDGRAAGRCRRAGRHHMADVPFSLARWFDEYAQRYPIDDKAAFSGKIAQTLGSTLGLVSEALATGGKLRRCEAGATRAQAIGQHVAHGIRAMMVPSSVASQQTAQQVIDQRRQRRRRDQGGHGVLHRQHAGRRGAVRHGGRLAYRLGSGALSGTLLAENSRNLMNWACPRACSSRPHRGGAHARRAHGRRVRRHGGPARRSARGDG
jgi:hypothetical protein